MNPIEQYYWYQALILTIVCFSFLILDLYILYKLFKCGEGEGEGMAHTIIFLFIVGVLLTIAVVTEAPKVFAYEGYVQIQKQ